MDIEKLEKAIELLNEKVMIEYNEPDDRWDIKVINEDIKFHIGRLIIKHLPIYNIYTLMRDYIETLREYSEKYRIDYCNYLIDVIMEERNKYLKGVIDEKL